MTMKRFYNYLLILIFVISCKIDKKSIDPNIIVNARLIRSYDSIPFRENIKYKTFDIRLSLINKSDKPISFWIMSTSWFDNFIINNDFNQYLFKPISHNFPIIKHLKSNDSIVYKFAIIEREHTMYQSVKSTKFGFVFIDSSRFNGFFGYDSIIGDKSLHNKVIWSNALYIKGKN